VLSRPLGVTSYDDSASAAAVALTLKALLRSSTVAPRSEQIGAPARAPALFRLESSLGTRSFAQGNASLEPRLGFGMSAWPRPFSGRLGVALGLSSGLGAEVDSPALTGRFGDWTITGQARARWLFGRFVLEPGAGVGVHFAALDGALASPQIVVHTRRTDASLDAGLVGAVRIGDAVDLGLRASASYLLRYQRYLVSGRTALELAPVWLEIGAYLGVALF
jgi:hypothetical protein